MKFYEKLIEKIKNSEVYILERLLYKMVAMLILGILAIIMGLIVLIWPKILNIIIAIWLVLWGIFQILAYYNIVQLIPGI